MIELGSGHYPEWDEDHPLHFVGHSAGAQVVRVLQQMLADKVCFFLLFLSRINDNRSFRFSFYMDKQWWVNHFRLLEGMRALQRIGY